jgi:hypothetical protein
LKRNLDVYFKGEFLMSLITVVTDASMDTRSAMHANFISALFAGEAIDNCSPCRLGSDGKVYMAVTASGVAPSDFIGFSADNVVSGGPVTVFGKGARFNYAAGMTPNTQLFVSATKGKLSDAVVEANDKPVALAISATDIVVIR